MMYDFTGTSISDNLWVESALHEDADGPPSPTPHLTVHCNVMVGQSALAGKYLVYHGPYCGTA